MEMVQQLFMAAFVAFVFSILVEKLACVTMNGDEWKSKRTKGDNAKSKSKSNSNSRNKNKSKKKVRFAVHDQIAIVVNNKLVKLDSKLPNNKQLFCPTSYDLKDVYLGANWIGEELMTCKEFGFHVELLQELEFDGIQNQREVPTKMYGV